MSSQPDRPSKLFTPEGADEALARVRPLVKQLQGLQQSIVTTNQQLDDAVAKLAAGNGYPVQQIKQQVATLTQHQLQLVEAFHSALQQLEAIGCLLKDLGQGLVDFYTMRDGEVVFLCWRAGEDRIRFWHSLDAGVAGRQPL